MDLNLRSVSREESIVFVDSRGLPVDYLSAISNLHIVVEYAHNLIRRRPVIVEQQGRGSVHVHFIPLASIRSIHFSSSNRLVVARRPGRSIIRLRSFRSSLDL
jgi:hypothetical protein